MLVQLGFSSLLFAFFSAVYGIIALVIGIRLKSQQWIKSGRQACLILLPLLSISIGVLITLLLQRAYYVDYVYQTVDNTQPVYLQLAALWGKQSGSLLFWSWLFALFIFIYTITVSKDAFFPTASLFLLVNLMFFLLLNLWVENPFHRLWIDINNGVVYKSIAPLLGTMAYLPENGLGMNPLLRHYGMVLHPPALYIGYIGVFIPVASQVSAMIHQPDDFNWVARNRRWYLFAWIFLAIGLVLGSRWAYDVLGWGGYWGWDPVEVSALIPFLLLSAYLHSAAGYVRTRRYQTWVTVCGLMTAFSIVFSIFVTRSGLIGSIHAFSVSTISNYLLGYTFVFLLFILFIIFRNGRKRQVLHNLETPTFSVFLQSRNFVFYAVILLFCLIAFFCLWGILLPTLTQLISGKSIAIGKDFYTAATGPLFLVLLFFVGVFPLTRWNTALSKVARMCGILSFSFATLLTVFLFSRVNIGSTLRVFSVWIVIFSASVYCCVLIGRQIVRHSQNRAVRSNGNMEKDRALWKFPSFMIHFSLLLMATGIIGIEFFQQETQLNLKVNEIAEFAGHKITLFDFSHTSSPEGTITKSDLLLDIGASKPAHIFPTRRFYNAYQQETTLPGIYSTLKGDLYAILMSSSVASTGEDHTFTIFYNPLINWLWIGGLLLCLGGFFAVSNRKRKAKQTDG